MSVITRLLGVRRLERLGDEYRFRVELSAKPSPLWRRLYAADDPGLATPLAAAGNIRGAAIFFTSIDKHEAIKAWLAAIDHRIAAVNLRAAASRPDPQERPPAPQA